MIPGDACPRNKNKKDTQNGTTKRWMDGAML